MEHRGSGGGSVFDAERDEGRILGPGNRMLLRFALKWLLCALAGIRGVDE
jgi:hypothetical protein